MLHSTLTYFAAV